MNKRMDAWAGKSSRNELIYFIYFFIMTTMYHCTFWRVWNEDFKKQGGIFTKEQIYSTFDEEDREEIYENNDGSISAKSDCTYFLYTIIE